MADLASEVSKTPTRFLTSIGFAGLVTLSLLVGSFTLFLIHTLTTWLSLNPNKAFDVARSTLGTTCAVWDSIANIQNSFVGIVDQEILPLYNFGVRYTVEPLVFVMLEAFSIATTGKAYDGLITDSEVKFEGYECADDGSEAAHFCGSVSYYKKKLALSDSSGVSSEEIVLSAATARRLSLESGNAFVPVIDTSELMSALEQVVSAVVIIGAQVSAPAS
jgi:hypothetical protein